MEDFARTIHEKTGLILTEDESLKLFDRYNDTETNIIDYDKFFDDIKNRIIKQGEQPDANILNECATSAHTEVPRSFEQLTKILYDNLSSKANNTAGKDILKKFYQLLSENHSPVVTKAQFKKSCNVRLALPLRDADVDEIFKKLDQSNVGVINTRLLIGEVLKNRKPQVVSICVGLDEHRAKTPDVRGSEAARITIDQKILNLQAPNPVECRAYSVAELESYLRDKVTERSTLTDNMAKISRRLFTDGGHHSGDPSISFDQVRYTFWKKLRLDVAERDLVRFWDKYSKNGSTILMSDLTNGIIRDLGSIPPLLEDTSLNAAERAEVANRIYQNNSLEAFFTSLRQHINDLINRESRAPHYLVHGTSKMTAEQARLYFRKKLLFDIESFSADLVSQVLRAYTVNNLVDVKRILTEAMSIKDTAATTACTTSAAATEGSVKEDFLIPQTLLNGATVTVTKMPSALQQGHQSPEEIESILRTKCNERSKDSHPHASLYKLFRDNGADTRAITRQGMHKLLIQLDIITNDRDFDAFFAKHDRGDGSIDIHAFLKRLLPPESADSDPYVPKDATALHKELVFTQALRQVTGYQREVGNLNGTTNFRLDKDFLDEVGRAVKPVETVRWQLPDEEHRSVEDLLQHLRQKRIEMEAEKAAAIGRPGSPRAVAASSAGPASRSSVRPSSPRASGGVSAVAGAAPGNGATPSAACEVGNNQDNQIVNATAVRPSSRNVALRFDDESTIASAVHNHFPPSALRPGSAPSGRRVTGTQLSKSLPARRGDEKDDQPPLCEININGSKVEPQRSVSPTQAQKSTTLQVGLPDRDRDYLKGALQSSLRNALRDMALQENPASTFVGTGGENQGEEQVDRPVRPMSASATVRPRSSNSTSGSRVLDCFSTATSSTLDSSAQQRAQHSMLLKQALNNNSTDNGAQPRVVNFAATSSTAATVPALPSCVTAADLSTITTTATTLSSTPREPIEIVSRYNQQVLRPSSASASVAKRPSTAPASRVRASPRLVVSASNSKNADTHNISAGNCSATVIAVPTGPETEELSQDVAPRPAKENKKKVVVPSLAGIGDATFSLHGAPPAPQAPEPPSVQQQQAHLEDCLYVLDPHYGSGAHHTYHSHTSRASPRVTQQLGRTTFATSVSGTRSPVRAPDASARFVYTGQRRTVRTDPMSARLVCMYKISKNHTITTNHEYGVFASSYARSMRRNANLHGKQQDAAFSAGVNTC